MMDLIKKHLFSGIAWGCVALVANMVVFDLLELDTLLFIFENFTLFALGIILISIGFITTGGLVYETKKIPFRLKLLIHIVIGIGTLLVVGFTMGFLTFDNLSDLAINIGINLLILLVVWVYYYLRDKREVEEINASLREKRAQRQLDTE